MLPAEHRVTDASTFSEVVRRGTRTSRPTLVVHRWTDTRQDSGTRGPVRAGFVVSKAVGGAVVRNRVKRRLRHLVAAQIRSGAWEDGTVLVVRARPAAADADSARLSADLERAGLDRAVAR